jgi:DNA-damage-inducible protein J
MAKTAMIRARTNEDVKTDAEDILKRLGLTMSDAVNLFLNQVRLHKGLPFEVRIPNKTTLRTFKKTDKGKELNEYKSMDEFIKKMAV